MRWNRDEADGDRVRLGAQRGACSASHAPGSSGGAWLLGGLLLGVLGLTTFACGPTGVTSFCTDQYDPLGVACDRAVPRIVLLSAERKAQKAVSGDALLWRIRASDEHVDPDGGAKEWHLTYVFPDDGQWTRGTEQTVTVGVDGVSQISAPLEAELFCLPYRPVEALDSRWWMHDTIRRLEKEGVQVELRAANDLHMVQNHECSAASSGVDGTSSYRAPEGYYDLRYIHGTFRQLDFREPE